MVTTRDGVYKSLLHEMTQTTPTCLWNDSASASELAYAIDNGAVGATCNPVIVLSVAKQERSTWMPRLQELIEVHPTATEDEVAWMLVEEISKSAAALLAPIFRKRAAMAASRSKLTPVITATARPWRRRPIVSTRWRAT